MLPVSVAATRARNVDTGTAFAARLAATRRRPSYHVVARIVNSAPIVSGNQPPLGIFARPAATKLPSRQMKATKVTVAATGFHFSTRRITAK